MSPSLSLSFVVPFSDFFIIFEDATQILYTTYDNGYLGSRNDEERSEMRNVVRLARPRESSNL